MIHLCLDTCTWIYLADGSEPGKLISYLDSEIHKDNIRIILPDLVLEEWKKKSLTEVQKAVDLHFKSSMDGLKKIKYLIETEPDDLALFFGQVADKDEDTLKLLVDSLNSKKDYLKNKAKENIKAIEEIFNHPSTIKTTYSQENINTATRLALEHAAPFKGKNSMADALIFFQLTDYLKDNNIEGAYFITWNTKDFTDNKTHLSPNLNSVLESVKGRFYTALAYAMTTIKSDVVTVEELKEIERIKLEAEEIYDEDWFCMACHEYRSRYSPISIRDEYPIIDQRRTLNPQQLPLFQLDKKKIKKYTEFLQGGTCDYCGAVHVKCPECKELMEFPDNYTYNEVKNCHSCGLRFNFKYIESHKGDLDVAEFIVLGDTRKCASCPNEFESREDNSDICQICEAGYAYGTQED